MRIDRDTLLKVARNTVERRVKNNRNIVCVYLTGSLLRDDPLLAGTTDIDLIFVHSIEPVEEREIIKYNEEVHIDIAHHYQGIYDQPRKLRTDPWIGSFMCADPLMLHDIQYWFEFTQASICAQFARPENVVQRARYFSDNARKIWLDTQENSAKWFPERLNAFMNALEDSGNAIAVLTGIPLTERRFLIQFPERAERIGRPGLAPGLLDLFMNDVIHDEDWDDWMGDWEAALDAVGTLPQYPARLHPYRKAYYLNVAKVFRSDHPAAALWLLLRNWTMTILSLPEDSPHRQPWVAACEKLNLYIDDFPERLDALDVYLDSVEEAVEYWGSRHGVN
jgi:hypothetical protein